MQERRYAALGTGGDRPTIFIVNAFNADWKGLRKESFGAIDFSLDHVQGRCGQLPGGRSTSVFTRVGRPNNLRRLAMLDNQAARRDQAGNLSVAELLQEPEHISIHRFFPDPLARTKIPAHQRCRDPRIEGGAVDGYQPAFTVTGDTDWQAARALDGFRPRLIEKPIDGSQYLLHLITNDVPAHFISLPVNPFTMRLVGEPAQRD